MSMTSNNRTSVVTPSLDLLQGQGPLSSVQINKASTNLADSKIGNDGELSTTLPGNGTNHLNIQNIKHQDVDQSKLIQGIGVVEDGQHFVTSTQSALSYQLTGNLAGTPGSQSLGNAATTALNVNDTNVLRVVTVQSTETGQNTLSSASAGVTYTVANVGSGGQVQGVFATPGNETVGAQQQVANVTDGAKYTYYPAVQATDAPSGGQFYVMMSPQDMIPVSGQATQRIIAPRAHSVAGLSEAQPFTGEGAIPVEFRKVETGARSSRDERRRATHNEVERRRRDKINTWIMKLAGVVPDCTQDQSKQGQTYSGDNKSKGGILSKALDYIVRLRSSNERMAETLKDHERLMVENQVLHQQLEEQHRDNALLRASLLQQQQQNIIEETHKMDPST